MKKRRMKKRMMRQAQVAAKPQAAPEPDLPILEAAEQHIEGQLTPETRESYLKIVVAGMRAGLENGPNSILAGLAKSRDPLADCAKGAIGLVLILRHQAKGIMPVQAMVPAAMTLMLKALGFADRTGIVKVGNDELVRATHIFTDTLMAKLGITKQMVQHAMVKVNGLTQDPVAMEQMKRAAGVVRHPDASQPTAEGAA